MDQSEISAFMIFPVYHPGFQIIMGNDLYGR